MDDFYTFPNRTLCSVLDEMRKAHETRNYSYLLGLIEEAQSLGNRMEAGLNDKHDVANWTVKRAELKAEIKKLSEQKKALEKELKPNESKD